MFGYTGTLVLILFLGWLSYYISFWPLGVFVAGGRQHKAQQAPAAPSGSNSSSGRRHTHAVLSPQTQLEHEYPDPNLQQVLSSGRHVHMHATQLLEHTYTRRSSGSNDRLHTPCWHQLILIVFSCMRTVCFVALLTYASCAGLACVLSCSLDAVSVCASQAAAMGGLPAQHAGVQLAAVLQVQLCHGAEAGPGGAVHLCRYGTCSGVFCQQLCEDTGKRQWEQTLNLLGCKGAVLASCATHVC